MLKLLKEIKRCRQKKLRGVLATIIRIEGSSYQKEGAKCFYSEDGNLTGILSGGCVEGDIIEHAKSVLETAQPKKIYYDFRREDDQVWGLGVGCNGAIEIFLEVVDPVEYPAETELMARTIGATEEMIIATITHSDNKSEIGKKWVVSSSGAATDKKFELQLKQNPAFLRRKSALLTFKDEEIFFDFIDPVPELFVFGAGPDAVPLVKTIKNMGWKVKVGDHRPGYLNPSNFPEADELISYPRDVIPNVQLNNNTYCVVMSHNFNQDRMVLDRLINSDVSYIGVLGPAKRTSQLLETIMPGSPNEEKQLGKLHGPVGLDIGAKTPEEIALSIAAELVNVYRGGGSRSLRKSAGEKFPIYYEKYEEQPLPL